MDPALIESIFSIAIRAGTSVLFATLGGILTERAGVLNLGIEGTLLMSALSGFAGAYYFQSAPAGLAIAMLAGALMALIQAFWCISLAGNQVAVGLALVILGSGLADFLGQRLGPGGGSLVGLVSDKFQRFPVPLLSSLPVVGGSVFDQDILTYSLYAVVPLLWYFLFRTQAGIHLRALGENPQAADALGINVDRLRYRYTLLGGVLIGIGGAHLSLAYTPGWSPDISGGRGWIAIAMIIFSLWNPLRAAVGAVLFGGVTAIQFRMQAVGSTIPAYFLNMLPYGITIVALIIVNRGRGLFGRSGIPAALGTPYRRE